MIDFILLALTLIAIATAIAMVSGELLGSGMALPVQIMQTTRLHEKSTARRGKETLYMIIISSKGAVVRCKRGLKEEEEEEEEEEEKVVATRFIEAITRAAMPKIIIKITRLIIIQRINMEVAAEGIQDLILLLRRLVMMTRSDPLAITINMV